MSTISLPPSTLEKLDSISRDFLWGKSTHLLSWDRCCSSKAEGGLGIRKAKHMNQALLAKLGWRVLHEKEGLWLRVVKAKYKIGEVNGNPGLVTKSTWSSTCKSIGVGLRDVVLPGLSWVVGDGNSTLFWMDKWLSDVPLVEHAIGALPPGYQTMVVRDCWLDTLGWNQDLIAPILPEEVRLELLSKIVDTSSGLRDRISWGTSGDGQFTVSSAYDFVTRDLHPRPQMKAFFDLVWKVVAPERVRVFLWLTGNRVLMTNMERRRRHLSATGDCQICRGGEETILHILRDCPAIEGVWQRILPSSLLSTFFSMPLLEWLYSNLGNQREVWRCPWATVFAITIWWSWKWRCDKVFGGNTPYRDKVQFVKDKAQEVMQAHAKNKSLGTVTERVERMITWSPPASGWYKVNTDGASHGNPGLASAGGVVRDAAGAWCCGFALNIGRCSAPLAELWGVYYGLCIAWEKGIMQLELEVDSEIVVRLLNTRVVESHPLSFLVHMCYGLISKNWLVRVTHVYREANRLADGLANYAFSLSLGLHLFPTMPDEVGSFLLDDLSGTAFPRMVRL